MTSRSSKATILIVAVVLVSVGIAIVASHHFRQGRARRLAAREGFVKQLQTPGYVLARDAANYLHRLRIQGRLPGFQKDQKGWILLLPPSNTNHYPIVLTLSMRNKNVAGPFPYHYTVVKQTAEDGWQLQRAWLTGTNGNTVEEFPTQ
jgi:hypothetical protein